MAGGTTQPSSTQAGAPSAGQRTSEFQRADVNPSDYGDQFSQPVSYDNPYGNNGAALADYFANLPSYQQPGGSTHNTQFASDLASRSTQQAAAQEAEMKAAREAMVQQSTNALNAYYTQKANQEWQNQVNALNAQIADLNSQKQTWQSTPSSSSNWGGDGGGGKAGGLASLRGFDK